jgi:fused signal recognition particle receptor
MISFLKKKSSSPEVSPEEDTAPLTMMSRLKHSLQKTRAHLGEGIARVFLGKKEIDGQTLQAIATQLLNADVGPHITQEVIQALTEQLNRQALQDPNQVMAQLQRLLQGYLVSWSQDTSMLAKPYVILVVGVNGTGKTTTVGKLAHYFQQQGKKVMLAAGDTFRAAAIEQLLVWGERNNIPVIAQHQGADSASVIFDAFQAAQARGSDILLADTAGRLHTKTNLMEELKKIKRVLAKLDPTAPHEVLLVLDAGQGQNVLVQAQEFHQAIELTGLVLTKLDGTAKGGAVFGISQQLNLPVRFVGTGESLQDLLPFEPQAYVEAMFDLT